MRSDIEKIFYLGRHLQGFDWKKLEFVKGNKFTNDKDTNDIVDFIVDTLQNEECITRESLSKLIDKVDHWQFNYYLKSTSEIEHDLINNYFEMSIQAMAEHLSKVVKND